MGLACPAPFGAGPHSDWQAVNTMMPETSRLLLLLKSLKQASPGVAVLLLLERERVDAISLDIFVLGIFP